MNRLILLQLDRQLSLLKETGAINVPSIGWIRTIRTALNMTVQQLAHRIGISQQALSALEKSEIEGRIHIHSLSEAAKALGCRLSYTFIPESSLETYLTEQIIRKAQEKLNYINHTMKLEEQQTSLDMQKHWLEDLIQELKTTATKQIWD